MVKHWLPSLLKRFREQAPPARLRPGRRVYAVGDVHGHLDRLQELHEAIRRDLAARPAADPCLLHIGDYIDRGPDSAGVVALLAAGPPLPGVPTVNLGGNHEWMMLQALDRGGEDAAHWRDRSGGAAALRSWGVPAKAPPEEWGRLIPAAHLRFLRGLGGHWTRDGYLFVHAGVRPGVRLEDQVDEDLLWIREPFLDWPGALLPEAPGQVVVHGHTPRPHPVVRRNRIGIDTGAGKGGPLTAAVLEGADVRFLQA